MNSRHWWFVFSVSLFIGILLTVDSLEDTADVGIVEDTPPLPRVSVVKVTPSPRQARINLYGEVTPHWQVTIKSQVNGEITHLNNNVTVGSQVVKNTPLIRIEDNHYQATVYDAQLAVAEAQLALLQAQHEAAQAENDWRQSGIARPATPLALRQPQLTIAERRVTAAKGQLASAQTALQRTTIASPFSGIITQRHVSLGETINVGDPLFHIVDNHQLDITVSLSKQQWQRLPVDWQTLQATLFDLAHRAIGQAEVVRGGDYLDPNTRQYPLRLRTTPRHAQELLAGDFIHVSLPGKTLQNTLTLPASAVSREGHIWYLDTHDRLRHITVEIMFHEHSQVVIREPFTTDTPWRIATTPLASFVAGHTVAAHVVDVSSELRTAAREEQNPWRL